MEYIFIILIAILFLTIEDLKGKNKKISERLNKLAEETGNPELSTEYISDSLKEALTKMKKEGNLVGAVKLLRINTSFSLLKAKEYVDKL